ncbi:hypothetical protein [Clostridium pasteurianum]|uniref:hypothetical protein n=1 Tax=Clostridium pasteurianum TaxID=1501 RepID=UPI0012BBFF98|nr:hypothetical protein [Clostridium pasteurianum]
MLVRINAKNENLDITAFLFFCLVDNFSYSVVHQTDIDASVEQYVEMILRYIKLN